MAEFFCVECGGALSAEQAFIPLEAACPICFARNVIPPTATVPRVTLPNGRTECDLSPADRDARLKYLYRQVPWYRREGPNSAALLIQACTLFAGCFGPAGLLAVLMLPLTGAICLNCLAGPIYRPALSPDGRLRQWSRANKVAAVLLLAVFLLLPVAILFVMGRPRGG